MKYFICSILLSVCTFPGISAQDLPELLDNYNARAPLEKVYVQFDNSSYTPGQTIFYKAYLQSGNKPSFLSTSLYLDWFDVNGNLVNHIVAPVMDATASGSYVLPSSFTGKAVRVSGYTRWMLNFDSSFFFQKTLAVIQKAGAAMDGKTLVPQATLGFYPEGGELVEKLPSVLAFKAINTAGEPVFASGSIVNSQQKTVADFATTHNGMGKLSFTPLPGEKYSAQWKDPQGALRVTPVPAALPSGIVFAVNNTSAGTFITIERSADAANKYKHVSIIATMHQQVLFSAGANLSDRQKITANIPAERFPSGVLRVTVLDESRQPLAERVVFVNNDEYRTEVSVSTDTVNLSRRGKNVYQVLLPDSLQASLSLAITDGDERFDASSNILSGLLLSPEIKGKIHNAAHYFSSADDSIASQLDLVMLTNGWRKFLWADVAENRIPELRYQADTSYLSIEGQVTKLKQSKIDKAGVMNLMLVGKDSTRQFFFAPLQKDGSFKQDNLVAYDTTTIYFRLNNVDIPSRSKVVIHDQFTMPGAPAKIAALDHFLADTTGAGRIAWIESERKRIDGLRKNTTLQEVTVFAKPKPRMEQLDERHSTGTFKNVARSYQFNILDNKIAQTFPDIFTWLQGKIPGVSITISGPEGNVKITRSTKTSLTAGPSSVAVYVNEVLTPPEAVRTIPVSQIAYVKAIPPPFVEEPNGGPGGAIAIYLLSGDDMQEIITNTPVQNLEKAQMIGYSPIKQFYSPNYAEQKLNMDEKDLRRTLLWQPNVMADAAGKTKIIFYNNDVSNSLRLVLEGMTSDGKLVHVEHRIGKK